MSKPLSLADHFKAEVKNLNDEHMQLEAIHLAAKGLGYDFTGHDNAVALLRDVQRFAQQWAEESKRDEESFISVGIHHVAKKNNIPCSPEAGVKTVELAPIVS